MTPNAASVKRRRRTGHFGGRLQPPSPTESDDEVIDINWQPCNITVDHRLAQPDTNYQYVNPSLLLWCVRHSLPVLLAFPSLCAHHIQNMVITAINTYAQRMDSAWIDLDWVEYLTWITLLIIMTIVNCQDKKMYWRKSNSPYHINFDFTEFITMERFNDITQLHVFVVPDGELAYADPLYQPRSFLTAFNNHVATTMRPGGRVDEPVTRVIIVDSWFGSPEMARKVLAVGLHSIMQICKRLYWPKEMPAADIVQALGPGYGSKVFMKSTVAGEHLLCCATTDGNIRRFWDPNGKEWVLVQRCLTNTSPTKVLLTYRRDNMINFHDVMRTYRWELRCLSFFLGVTEVNAFSAFKYFRVDGDLVGHGEFRWRLAESLKDYIKTSRKTPLRNPL
ncbi:hypothetical protein [Absidia glauca]|uniref:PiggyBac transposable element-derived protein domain-containing protein n=1 Tax=Absidia glauca TaxID=4829 RepID=A0A168PUT4_ABSGL|nr:hypothetical protein [Absidia glauca]